MRQRPVIFVFIGIWVVMAVMAIAVRKALQRTTPEPAPALLHAAAVQTQAVTSANTVRYWQDPSIPPEVLERAFAAPSPDLPPEALPVASNLHPSPEAWSALQLDQNSIAH